jgi:hypothetical protein
MFFTFLSFRLVELFYSLFAHSLKSRKTVFCYTHKRFFLGFFTKKCCSGSQQTILNIKKRVFSAQNVNFMKKTDRL